MNQLIEEQRRIEARLGFYQPQILRHILKLNRTSTTIWGFELLRAMRLKGLVELVDTKDYGDGLYVEYYSLTPHGIEAARKVQS